MGVRTASVFNKNSKRKTQDQFRDLYVASFSLAQKYHIELERNFWN